MIEYPRTCDACERIYNSKQTFCTHKKKCAEYVSSLKEKRELSISIEKDTRNTVNNTMVNSTVNSVVINVQGSFNGLSQTLAPILKTSSLSARDIKCVQQVLLMLRNEGVTTPEALRTLIKQKSVTIQQLAEDIKKSADKGCHAAIEYGASEVVVDKKKTNQSKQEINRLLDTHLRHSVVHLFQTLVLKQEDGDLQVTSESLASNPLYLSSEGMSVWSQNSGIKAGNTAATKFGTPNSEELCSWLLVQERRLWNTLIMDCLISRLENFLIEEYTGPMKAVKKAPEIEDPAKYLIMKSMMDSEDEEDYCIGGHRYEGKYSDLMNRIRGFKNEGTGRDAFVAATTVDLKKNLGETCKETPSRGWHCLTKYVTQQPEQQILCGVEQLCIKE